MNYGCRISRVTMKSGGDFHILNKSQKNIVADMIHESASLARQEGAISGGVFFVTSDGSVKSRWGYDTGTTALHTIGGAAILKANIENSEND